MNSDEAKDLLIAGAGKQHLEKAFGEIKEAIQEGYDHISYPWDGSTLSYTIVKHLSEELENLGYRTHELPRGERGLCIYISWASHK